MKVYWLIRENKLGDREYICYSGKARILHDFAALFKHDLEWQYLVIAGIRNAW